jgi:vacuolar protein sorting-associated protein 35
MATLGIYLDAIISLKERVGIRTILSALVDRLASHVEASGSDTIPPEANAFKLMNDCVTKLTMERANMTLVETLNLQNVLTDFALRCYNGHSAYVSHCLNTCCSLIEKTDFAPRDDVDMGVEDESFKVTRATIEELLSTVLSSLALRVMELPHVAKLMSYLHWDSWKEVASKLLRAVINAENKLAEADDVEQLFGMITPLLRDHESKTQPEDDEPSSGEVSAEFKAEQLLVARVIHLMENEDTDIQFMMYGFAKKNFTSGGKARMQYTFTPLVFAALSLARRVYALEVERATHIQELKKSGDEEAAAAAAAVKGKRFGSKKVLQLVLEILNGMATTFPEVALRLFLNAAQAADEFNYSAIAYEFLKEALLTYESEVTDSKAQMRVLHAIIGTLLTCRNFSTEDYEALITKTAQYANKLLRKPDQCKMITLCSHLFWPKRLDEDATEGAADFYDDSERVQECLERALKIASVCNPMLFVDILDHYVYYYENCNPIIQARYISGLIALINEQFASGQADPESQAHYKNTIEYIKNRQMAEETSEKFLSIQC